MIVNKNKKSKSEVRYSKGNPTEHCGRCVYFEPKRYECEKVKGVITHNMWCKLFKEDPHHKPHKEKEEFKRD